MILLFLSINRSLARCPLAEARDLERMEENAHGKDPLHGLGCPFNSHGMGHMHDFTFGYPHDYLGYPHTFHGLEHDIFGHGTLNDSYSRYMDGSFYGRGGSSSSSGSGFGSSSSSGSGSSSGSSGGGFGSSSGSGSSGGAAAGKYSGGNYSSSGASGTSFKFTHLSAEANLTDYKRSFSASKVFVFTAQSDGIYKVCLVSTTKNYHPQMRMCEINKGGGEKYVEIEGSDKGNGMYSTGFSCKKGREYVIEIGASEKVNTAPFENINTGGFICSMSAEKKSLQECLAQQEYKISLFGKIGSVPIENKKEMDLSNSGSGSGSGSASGGASGSGSGSGTGSGSASGGGSASGSASASGINCGSLDYSVTPFFDESKGSLTLYYHYESSYSYSQSSYSSSKQSSTVEFQCSYSSSSSQVFNGIEKSRNMFEFHVESKSACNLADMLR